MFGGGSDLPEFLKNHEGAVLSFAINKRVYVIGHPYSHRTGISLRYSNNEDVDAPTELRHPIARLVLERYDINDFDISVMADVPAGTGLGSSSSFTVAFLAFVRRLKNLESTAIDLAREACEIEINLLNEPIGYQDQWAASLGGINLIRFRTLTEVNVEKIGLTASQLLEFENSMFLLPVGSPRSASAILQKQSSLLTPGSDAEKLTLKMVSLVEEGKRAITSDMLELGPLLDEAWRLKRSLSKNISSTEVDETYATALEKGATGGKLLGAGKSGYLLCFVPAKNRAKFTSFFPKFMDVKISSTGAGIIHDS